MKCKNLLLLRECVWVSECEGRRRSPPNCGGSGSGGLGASPGAATTSSLHLLPQVVSKRGVKKNNNNNNDRTDYQASLCPSISPTKHDAHHVRVFVNNLSENVRNVYLCKKTLFISHHAGDATLRQRCRVRSCFASNKGILVACGAGQRRASLQRLRPAPPMHSSPPITNVYRLKM